MGLSPLKAPMHICLYTHTALPDLGGLQLVVDALARQFTAAGHPTVVLAPRRRSAGRLAPGSAPYPTAWHPRFFSTRRGLGWYSWWLARLHRRHGFDVIHCHGSYPCGYVAAGCRQLAGVPLVVTSHGDDLGPQSIYDRKPALRGRYRWALARADAAVAISSFTARRLREACPELRQIEPLPNGVDVRRFSVAVPRPPELHSAVEPGRYLLFLGRLDRRKGVDLLLTAFARNAAAHDVQLVVAGRGPELAALQAQAVELGLDRRVCFLGAVEGPTKTYLLQNTLCTLLVSRTWEAFPLVLLESYAAGRPVIATRLEGLSDFVRSDETGLLVPPECVASLAEAIQRAIGDREQLARWGVAARRLTQDYDWSAVAACHLALYERLARQRQAVEVPSPGGRGDRPIRSLHNSSANGVLPR
jgi:glycosyltransferase involved in cell wall biosynthesis